jgi:hypothetical protein
MTNMSNLLPPLPLSTTKKTADCKTLGGPDSSRSLFVSGENALFSKDMHIIVS